MLRSCPEVLGRLLRKTESVLLAAKVLVISRLLYKKLSEYPQSPEYIDTIRIRLGKSRQKLLAHINGQLESSHLNSQELVEAMCAFSLATSSSATDVLRHFHHVRSGAISISTRDQDTQAARMLNGLRLWFHTLQETNTIFPQQLVQALLKLGSVPLFNDHEIGIIEEFDYDIHARWIGNDIKNFIPYIRHEDLQSSAAVEQLIAWAPKTLDILLQNFTQTLETIYDPRAIVQLRKECMNLWLCSHRLIAGVDRARVLDGLRDTFKSRLLGLAQARSQDLVSISRKITTLVKECVDGASNTPHSIWHAETASMDVLDGASDFIQAIQNGVHGTNDTTRSIVKTYHEWRITIDAYETLIKELRDAKWEFGLDDLEYEADLEGNLEDLLSKDDPDMLSKALSRYLVRSFNDLETSFDELAKSLRARSNDGPVAAFLLRVLRGIIQDLPKAYQGTGFASTVIVDLQSIISKSAVQSVMVEQGGSISKGSKRLKVPGRILWNGDPELPVLPSPWTIKSLRCLHLVMADIGSDLWTYTAVEQVKKRFRASLIEVLPLFVEADQGANGHDDNSLPTDVEEPKLIGSATNGDSSVNREIPISSRNDSKTQLLFDIAYLEEATSSSTRSDEPDVFDEYLGSVERETSLQTSSLMQVKKNSMEYWKRTSLLFGMLA